MASRNYSTLLAGLSSLGFCLLWGIMGLNGGSEAMFQTAWTGVFPDGSLLKTRHTGILPVDFPLNILITFFSAVSNLRYIDAAPYLMLLDLTTSLLVINLMVLVESRRRSGFWLRSPALWQYLWNCGGVAVFLPIWTYLYLKQRSKGSPQLPEPGTGALPLTALLSICLELPLLVPAWIGADSATIQQGVLFFFLGPPIFSAFHSLVSGAITSSSKRISKPVKTAYYITAVISAVVHVYCVVYAIMSPDLSLGRVYFPQNDSVQSGQPNIMTEAAFLFLKYDYLIININVLILGGHILRTKSNSKESFNTRGSIPTLVGLTAIFGPGAGLAYAACCDEEPL